MPIGHTSHYIVLESEVVLKAFSLISLGLLIVIYRLVKIKYFFGLREILFHMLFFDMAVNLPATRYSPFVFHVVEYGGILNK